MLITCKEIYLWYITAKTARKNYQEVIQIYVALIMYCTCGWYYFPNLFWSPVLYQNVLLFLYMDKFLASKAKLFMTMKLLVIDLWFFWCCFVWSKLNKIMYFVYILFIVMKESITWSTYLKIWDVWGIYTD